MLLFWIDLFSYMNDVRKSLCGKVWSHGLGMIPIPWYGMIPIPWYGMIPWPWYDPNSMVWYHSMTLVWSQFHGMVSFHDLGMIPFPWYGIIPWYDPNGMIPFPWYDPMALVSFPSYGMIWFHLLAIWQVSGSSLWTWVAASQTIPCHS